MNLFDRLSLREEMKEITKSSPLSFVANSYRDLSNMEGDQDLKHVRICALPQDKIPWLTRPLIFLALLSSPASSHLDFIPALRGCAFFTQFIWHTLKFHFQAFKLAVPSAKNIPSPFSAFSLQLPSSPPPKITLPWNFDSSFHFHFSAIVVVFCHTSWLRGS